MKTWKQKFRNALVFILAMAMVCGNINMAAIPALAEENVVAKKTLMAAVKQKMRLENKMKRRKMT